MGWQDEKYEIMNGLERCKESLRHASSMIQAESPEGIIGNEHGGGELRADLDTAVSHIDDARGKIDSAIGQIQSIQIEEEENNG
jgi:hypothetical protein